MGSGASGRTCPALIARDQIDWRRVLDQPGSKASIWALEACWARSPGRSASDRSGLAHAIPNRPELLHFSRLTERDPDEIIHAGKTSAYEDAILFEVIHHLNRGLACIHHGKVCI